MKIIDEAIMLLNAQPGAVSEEYTNRSCDILALAVLGSSSGDYKVIVEGALGYDDTYTPLAVFPLGTYKLIDGEDGITADGIYETGIEGIGFIRVKAVANGGSEVPVSVYARFANSCIA